MDYETTRKRLYCLSLVINALVLPSCLVAIAILGKATEPVVQWPVEFARFFTPGLPANLVAAGLKFPVPAITLTVVVVTVFWMNRVVKIADDEQAFQTWPRFGAAASPPIPAPAARIIARISPFWWLLPVFVLLVLAFGAGSSSDPSERATVQGNTVGTHGNSQSSCVVACDLHRLARGESVRVTVAARRKRNETRLLLARGETYTARFIESDGWRDGSYDAGPQGVEFEGWTRRLGRTVEWLRPYPQGEWFQLIGRIDRGRDVFPVLERQYPEKPFAFQAPEDGELVLLVNDVLYGNNGGFLTVEISTKSES